MTRRNRRPGRLPTESRGTFFECLEGRAVLDSTGILPPPPLPRDGTVIAPPPAPAVATAFRATLPGTSPNGLPVFAVVTAVDASGRPVGGYRGTASVTSSDAAATLPETVTFVRGRAAVRVTFTTAGPQTLTFTDTTTPSITATATTTVARPAVATSLVVTSPQQVRTGVQTPIGVMAVDASGRLVPTFNGSATVTSSDSGATLPLVEIVFRNGRATFPMAFATVGQQSVTVTTLSEAALTGVKTVTVLPPQVLKSFAVLMPQRVSAGASIGVSLVALDETGRPVRGYSGTAALTSSDPGATLPATVTFQDGRAVARVTFATTGSQTLSVAGGAAGDITGTASTTVLPAPIVTRFAVVLPRGVAAGASVQVLLVALDERGRAVPSFSGTATLVSSDAAATLPPSVQFTNGKAQVRVTFATLGDQTLTATSGTVSGTGRTRVGEVSVQPLG